MDIMHVTVPTIITSISSVSPPECKSAMQKAESHASKRTKEEQYNGVIFSRLK